jgi:hypothetical protein
MKLTIKKSPKKVARFVIWDEDTGMPYYPSPESYEVIFDTRQEAENYILWANQSSNPVNS